MRGRTAEFASTATPVFPVVKGPNYLKIRQWKANEKAPQIIPYFHATLFG
jgi:hypothetical protein